MQLSCLPNPALDSDWPQHPRQLSHRRLRVIYVAQQEGEDHGIEGTVGEGQALGPARDQRHVLGRGRRSDTAPGLFDHGLAQIYPDHPAPGLAAHTIQRT